MEIYLLRHGAAEERSPTGRDRDRRLTAEGEAEVRLMARRVAIMGMQPKVILASPYVRAQATAAIFVEVLAFDGELLAAPVLVPDSSPTAVWEEIRGFPEAASLLLISHEPLVSATLAWMTGVDRAGPFATAGLARVDVETLGPLPLARMRFLMAPGS